MSTEVKARAVTAVRFSGGTAARERVELATEIEITPSVITLTLVDGSTLDAVHLFGYWRIQQGTDGSGYARIDAYPGDPDA